ncbi:hypothetical protein Val02_91420 [Virgisporangium aliadipatigenens]|uniref:Uncharacterized protein n=1 Tax=Virgisporangium aliadipatigenens TaxID=741659 RepID=A0A8J4DW88_9ACTN|nr:hypothetical protein [Virgisporangium aliadipatigenens]GIJ52256.1 hypothetical protein Val02_91420 [Virgisporangium aliadipatigenens]
MNRAERRASAKGRDLPPAVVSKIQDAGRKAPAPRQWATRRRG